MYATNTWTTGQANVSGNFEERRMRASLLHASLVEMAVPPFHQADYVRVRVMGRGSPAMYLLIYWTFSKNKNWSFFAHVPPLAKPK